MIVEVTLAFLALLWLVYKYYTSQYTYWKDRSVPYIEPHFPFGTERDFALNKVSFGEHYQNHYNKYKNEKLVGCFLLYRPFLMIRDPELIKNIMVKDFNHFVDRGLFDAEVVTPVNRTLFLIEGQNWKHMRNKLSPAFTSGKMKIMFHLMEACVEELRKALHPVAEQNGNIDVKDFMARFTTDVISSCAFGLESNTIENPNSEFRQEGKKMFQKPRAPRKLQQRFAFLLPRIYRLLRLPLCTNVSDDFFKKIISDTVEYRETNGVVRNDFIDLLIKIKHNKSLSDDDKSETGHTTDTTNGHSEEGKPNKAFCKPN